MKNRKYGIDLSDIALKPAKHEAGHYIVGKVLGFNAKAISVTVNDLNGTYSGGSDVHLHEPIGDISSIKDYLERRIQVLSAGAFAESLVSGEVDHELANETLKNRGAVDLAKLRELTHLLSNIQFSQKEPESVVQKNLTEIIDSLCDKSIYIVEQYSVIIETIAERLSSKVKKLNVIYMLEEQELESLADCSMAIKH